MFDVPIDPLALVTDQPPPPLLGWFLSPRGPVLHCDSAEQPDVADLVRLPVVGSSMARVQWVVPPSLVGFRSVVDRPVQVLDDVLLDRQGEARCSRLGWR